jgi:peroxiredoxin
MALLVVATGSAGEATKPGSPAPVFALTDVHGQKHSLEQYLGNRLVVLMFIATQCPISNDYNERMAALHEDYAGTDVAILGINSNRQESVEEIAEHAEKYRFGFPILKDVNNVVADAYGAEVTPEVYVIDSKGVLRYHGRIDDSRDPDDITVNDLRDTLDALLAGKDVPKSVTKAFGCSIKRVKAQG